jgi:tetratricopeptide (TPR) repeat protein
VASLVACLIALGMPVASPAQSDSGAESGSEAWYVLRGDANMTIGNYRAAIEAYEKATQLNPGNRSAMRQLGLAYERQGLTARAIEQYDRYLARFDDDPEIAFKQAEYLGWSRYAYRRADAIRYYRMGLARRDDPARRHELARLLAQDRSDLDAALEEYRALLARDPRNATWREEYRELLLWDERHLDEAIREQRRLAEQRPGDFEVSHQLARLVARRDPRGAEAVSRYAELVEQRPRDAALRLEYAELLSGSPRQREQAIAQYRTLLAQQPKSTTREALADLLSGREQTRSEALEHYRRLVRERPRDVELRLKYARLLGSERRDAREAIRQYSAVVEQDPRNSRAHAGLAESYAWIDDRDAALHHSQLAVRYGARSRDVFALRQDLLRGREPRLTPLLRGLVQRGDEKSDLSGAVMGVAGRADLTPFVTAALEGGVEDYWSRGENAFGGFLRLAGEYRPAPGREIELGIAYHTLADDGGDVLGELAFAQDGERWKLRAGFERTLRHDSYVALVGDRVGGVSIGAARENRLYGEVGMERARLEASLRPYAGWVSADEVDDNFFAGVRGRVAYLLLDRGWFELAPLATTEIYHYDEDAFGVVPSDDEPLPGGYFSPQFFFEQTLGLSLRVRWSADRFLELDGGPALQLVDESEGSSETELGGRARLSLVSFVSETLYWTLELDFSSIGDAYSRLDARAGLTFKF